jgi:hypothetical protein
MITLTIPQLSDEGVAVIDYKMNVMVKLFVIWRTCDLFEDREAYGSQM